MDNSGLFYRLLSVSLSFYTKEDIKMSLFSLFLIAVGLSMDAFAVSVCKGLALKDIKLKHMAIAGLWFGGFQALMPTLGYLVGYRFQDKITFLDHWIAFALLGLIGGNMIKEALSKDENEEAPDASLKIKDMLILAIATSIDALAVGVSFSFIPNLPIVPAVCFIGVITFILSAVGVKVGSLFGTKYKSKAELIGGIILVLMGVKILLEHLGVI